jgi:hypothetical protein
MLHLYFVLWAANIIATSLIGVGAYIAAVNADRKSKKAILALMVLAGILGVYFQIDALARAERWVPQSIEVAITGQVQRLMMSVPTFCYLIVTSRSLKAFLGFCRYSRELFYLPRPDPANAMPSLRQVVRNSKLAKTTA